MATQEQYSFPLSPPTVQETQPTTTTEWPTRSSPGNAISSSPARVAASASTSNVTPSSRGPSLSRKQHAANRARILALSKQLQTRLQYATFKVEHGWSKQSLSEVENLYYRHCKAMAGTGATATGSSSTSTTGSHLSPSTLRKNSIPSTPRSSTKPYAPATAAPIASKQSSYAHDTDVFGGLVTPPASGGTFPAHIDRDSLASNNPSSSGLVAQQSSPSAGLERKSSVANIKGKSYADFWSKIGAAGAGQGSEKPQ